ncbi:hypothetical protein ABES25_05980 [Bacillus gobiensis]|uniref:hypothetical protein n=1 Tax=Bacillus gobiensis TaxID=1441095 RepID=UPI003D258BD9
MNELNKAINHKKAFFKESAFLFALSMAATFTLTSTISHEVMGTNMSRFIEQLEIYLRKGLPSR